ncbi:sugar carrier protein C-like [Vigna radiata var. radiata]|uniref:Sugar carrier protein C-like n=1 Tax=Vigna radiata var. radiata TaxID=3916 RepID=A0A1S3VZV7_VIGRR|nr:sugar carrier protein C-like [Vigna radiata var. radiata]
MTVQGKFTRGVSCTYIATALYGLVFGYHLGISGGMSSMDFFLKKFLYEVYEQEKNIKSSYCKFDSQILTLYTSSLYLAALIASVFASFLNRLFGRRGTIVIGIAFIFVSAFFRVYLLGSSAKHVWVLILSRILFGLGIGCTHQSLSMYISEVAPGQHRRVLDMMLQLAIATGIFVANVFNYISAKMENGEGLCNSVRFEICSIFCYSLFAFMLHESPYSWIERGFHEIAKKELIGIRETTDVEEEFKDLMAANECSKAMKDPWISLLKRQYRPQLTFSIIIPLFQQLTGINVIIFYAPILLKSIGFGANASFLYAMIIGGCNAIATLVSIFIVNKFSRRTLFLKGGIQMFICQIVITVAIACKFGLDGNIGMLPKWYTIVVVCGICVYVAGFAWSWGPLGWLVPSEIFSLEVRSAAQSINVSLNMMFTFVIAQIFTTMLCHMKFGLFIFFACMLIMMNIFIYKLLLETKGVSIEEMHVMWQNHPYWKKFVKPIDVTVSDEC